MVTKVSSELRLVALPGGTAVVEVWHNGELAATVIGCGEKPGVIISTPNSLHVESYRPDIPSEIHTRALLVTVTPRG